MKNKKNCKEILEDLKYYLHESDDIDEIKEKIDFLINMNLKAINDIHKLKKEIKQLYKFFNKKEIIYENLISVNLN